MSRPAGQVVRDRMVEAGADLFAEHGFAAVSMPQAMAKAHALRGSIYHHFPGAKRRSDLEITAWRRHNLGCPVNGIIAGVGPGESEELRAATSDTLSTIVRWVTTRLEAKSLDGTQARLVATGVPAGFNGATIMSRADRMSHAFQTVPNMILRMLGKSLVDRYNLCLTPNKRSSCIGYPDRSGLAESTGEGGPANTQGVGVPGVDAMRSTGSIIPTTFSEALYNLLKCNFPRSPASIQDQASQRVTE